MATTTMTKMVVDNDAIDVADKDKGDHRRTYIRFVEVEEVKDQDYDFFLASNYFLISFLLVLLLSNLVVSFLFVY